MALPTPDANAQAHSKQLTERLVALAAGAPLPISTFMQSCLYEPGLGYYMAGAQKFGPRGDFITAPELSPLFGACVAEQCAEILQLCGGGLLELGAGSGRLALSILQNLSIEAWAEYTIIEPSAELQQRQRKLLAAELAPEMFAKVTWLQSLPESFTGVVLANEVMDALPVERLFRTASGISVEVVCVDGAAESGLRVTDGTLSTLPEDHAQLLAGALGSVEADLSRRWGEGYRSEVSLLLQPWVQSLASCLRCGALLLIDYGYPRQEYYMEERRDGTLQCFYQHHAHNDITFWPGLQDITAHVDFTSVVEAGDAAELSLLGYTSQAAFLLGCGLTEKATRQSAVWGGEGSAVTSAQSLSRAQHQQAINRLTLPGEMGERFQVMALGRGIESELCGFSFADLSHRL